MMLQIPAELVKSIHDYLMTRPMREVEILVMSFRENVKEIKDNGNEK